MLAGSPHEIKTKTTKAYLRATRDGISPNITVQPLHLRTLPTARVTQPTKDLRRLASAEFKSKSRLCLATRNRTAQLQHRLGITHHLTLVDQTLKPSISGLNLARHLRELHADDGVVDELLPESAALVGVLDALLVADAREADRLDDDADALVVEVCHDDFEAAVLLSDQVLHGDLDVFEGDVCGTAGPDALAVHAACADATEAALDEQDGDAVHAFVAGADGGGEVVRPVRVVSIVSWRFDIRPTHQIPLVIHFFSPLTM